MKKLFAATFALSGLLAFLQPASAQSPSIVTDPASQTNTVGDTVTFSVSAVGDAPLFYQWQKDDVAISGATDSSYVIVSVVTADSADNPGYAVGVTNSSGSVTSAVATLTVNKADQTINFGTLASKTYGDSSFNVSATSSSGLTVAFSIVSGPATLSGGTNINITGAGTVVVRASQTGDADYNPAPDVDQSFAVAKALLTVTADDASRSYGAADPEFTATFSGFVNGDTASVIAGNPDFSTTASATSSVAGSPYSITPSLGTLSAANYDFTFVDGNLSVTPAVLTVTAESTNRTYGAANPTFSASYAGFVNGEDVSVITGTPVLSTTADSSSGVGNYPITAAQGTLSAENYTFGFVNGTLAITKAILSVTADDQSRTYGAENPVFTASISGFVNSDTLAVVSGSPEFSTSATTNSSVAASPYSISPALGTLSAANYDFTFVDGSLSITPALLTLSAENKTRTYGAANPTLTASYSGFVNGEDVSALFGAPNLSTSADDASSVAGSPYVISITAGTLAAANYTFAFVDGSLFVTPATLTVAAEDTNRVYGAANPTFTASYSGFVNGEDAMVLSGSPTLTSTADSLSGAGLYPISAEEGTLSAANYTFSFEDGILTVNKAALTVTADDKSRVYGAINPVFSASFSGFVNGDTATVISGSADFSTPATVSSSVSGSPYSITPSLGTLSAANYDFTTFVDGNLTITPATLIVTADDKSRTYGAANPVLTASYSGFVNGEDDSVLSGSPNLSVSADANSNVAGSPYAISVTSGTLSAANYDFSFVNGNLSVTPAPLTVTAENTNRIYGAENPGFTASFSGFVNGEDASVISGSPAFTTSATTNSPVPGSPYLITPEVGTLSAANYAFTTFVDGQLTVEKAPLLVTVNALSKTYGEENPPLIPVYIGFVNNEDESVLSGSPSILTTADASSGVAGSPYAVTVATGTLASDNYDISTQDGTLSVTPASLTITSDDKNRLYGAANPAFTGSIDGLQNADDITVTYSTAATPASPIGTYEIGQALIDPNGKLPNYNVTTNDGTLTVTAALLTITSDSTNRIYGASNPAFTGSIVGLENGDNILAEYSVTATTNSFAGNYVISQTLNDPDGKLGNYDVTTNNGFLSITPAALIVSADSTNRAVGQPNPVFTGSIVGIQNNDDITANYTTTADTDSPTGLYDIVPELQDPDGKLVNYSVTTNNGVLTVDGLPSIVEQPSSLVVGAGSNAVFNVAAEGTSLSFQWRRDGTNLVDDANVSGATTSNLMFAAATPEDATSDLSVSISNSAGSVTSSVVSLTVITPPAVVTSPASITNIAGTTATFAVAVSGDAPLHYQWRFEGVDIPDEMFSSLSVLNVQETNAGSYTVVVTNFAGSVTSAPAVLSVYYSLNASAGFGGTVAKLPDVSGYAPGSVVSLTATPDTGFVFTGWAGDASGMANPLNVTMNTNKIIRATFMGPGGEIVIDNDDPRAEFEGFWYTLDYINPHYGVDYRYTSPGTNIVTARATYRPEIVRPGNYDVYLFYPQRNILRTTNAQWVVAYNGGNVSLGLDQHSNGGQWFQIASGKPFIAGTNQFVRVSNNTGETETNAYVMADAVRFVYSADQGTAPTFLTQPQSQVVNQTSNATFTVQAAGTGTLAYQWRFNNEPIIDATNTTLTVTNVQPSDAGNYSVVVIHSGGSASSSNAVLSVNLPPTITSQPANKTIIAGQSASFSVAVTGTGPFAYQWQFNSSDIPGATGSSYSLANAFAADAGNYSVVVSNVASVISSASAVLTVNADTTRPTISFVYPSVGGKVTNAEIVVTGSAKDSIGVSEVKYVFGGTTNTASGTKPWATENLTLVPGTNVIVAWAMDLSGNESIKKTNTFYYNTTNLLVLNIVGSGQVTGLTNGQPLLVGRPYSATAFIGPGTNYIFTNWTGSVTSTNKTLSFMMQSNMVLNANFILNPYLAAAGKYNGLFSEPDGVRHERAGFFTITLSSKSSYTGKLLMDGNTLPISGKFDQSGQLNRTISRSKFGKSTLTLALALDWSTTNETIHGTVGDGVWTSDLIGDRAVFDVNFHPNTNFVGRYTALIPQADDAPTDAPGGYGYLLLSNSAAGIVTISKGALADGAVLSQRVPVSKFGQWPLYVPAYKAITRYTNGSVVTTNLNELRGALIGWISFTNNPTRNISGTVNWIKTAMSPTNVFYPDGFTHQADLIASGYTVPAAGTRLLNLTNTTVILADGNLSVPFTNIITIQNNNLATLITTNNQFKISFDARTGLMKGTFLHPENSSKLTSFTGAVLQKQNYGAGAFLGADESGSVLMGR